MKALVYTRYGAPDVLQLKEVEKPSPRDDEVLIKIHAVSINGSDRIPGYQVVISLKDNSKT